MRIFIVSLLLVLLATIARADVPDHLGWVDAFQLWTGCQPVSLGVNLQKDNAPDLDLTEEQIEIAVRSRLRSARVYHESVDPPYLEVTVHVASQAFRIRVELLKLLRDEVYSNYFGHEPTWETTSLGTHGNNANFILQSVSQHIDKFLDEYLRVNASAC